MVKLSTIVESVYTNVRLHRTTPALRKLECIPFDGNGSKKNKRNAEQDTLPIAIIQDASVGPYKLLVIPMELFNYEIDLVKTACTACINSHMTGKFSQFMTTIEKEKDCQMIRISKVLTSAEEAENDLKGVPDLMVKDPSKYKLQLVSSFMVNSEKFPQNPPQDGIKFPIQPLRKYTKKDCVENGESYQTREAYEQKRQAELEETPDSDTDTEHFRKTFKSPKRPIEQTNQYPFFSRKGSSTNIAETKLNGDSNNSNKNSNCNSNSNDIHKSTHPNNGINGSEYTSQSNNFNRSFSSLYNHTASSYVSIPLNQGKLTQASLYMTSSRSYSKKSGFGIFRKDVDKSKPNLSEEKDGIENDKLKLNLKTPEEFKEEFVEMIKKDNEMEIESESKSNPQADKAKGVVLKPESKGFAKVILNLVKTPCQKKIPNQTSELNDIVSEIISTPIVMETLEQLGFAVEKIIVQNNEWNIKEVDSEKVVEFRKNIETTSMPRRKEKQNISESGSGSSNAKASAKRSGTEMVFSVKDGKQSFTIQNTCKDSTDYKIEDSHEEENMRKLKTFNNFGRVLYGPELLLEAPIQHIWSTMGKVLYETETFEESQYLFNMFSYLDANIKHSFLRPDNTIAHEISGIDERTIDEDSDGSGKPLDKYFRKMLNQNIENEADIQEYVKENLHVMQMPRQKLEATKELKVDLSEKESESTQSDVQDDGPEKKSTSEKIKEFIQVFEPAEPIGKSRIVNAEDSSMQSDTVNAREIIGSSDTDAADSNEKDALSSNYTDGSQGRLGKVDLGPREDRHQETIRLKQKEISVKEKDNIAEETKCRFESVDETDGKQSSSQKNDVKEKISEALLQFEHDVEFDVMDYRPNFRPLGVISDQSDLRNYYKENKKVLRNQVVFEEEVAIPEIGGDIVTGDVLAETTTTTTTPRYLFKKYTFLDKKAVPDNLKSKVKVGGSFDKIRDPVMDIQKSASIAAQKALQEYEKQKKPRVAEIGKSFDFLGHKVNFTPAIPEEISNQMSHEGLTYLEEIERNLRKIELDAKEPFSAKFKELYDLQLQDEDTAAIIIEEPLTADDFITMNYISFDEEGVESTKGNERAQGRERNLEDLESFKLDSNLPNSRHAAYKDLFESRALTAEEAEELEGIIDLKKKNIEPKVGEVSAQESLDESETESKSKQRFTYVLDIPFHMSKKEAEELRLKAAAALAQREQNLEEYNALIYNNMMKDNILTETAAATAAQEQSTVEENEATAEVEHMETVEEAEDGIKITAEEKYQETDKVEDVEDATNDRQYQQRFSEAPFMNEAEVQQEERYQAQARAQASTYDEQLSRTRDTFQDALRQKIKEGTIEKIKLISADQLADRHQEKGVQHMTPLQADQNRLSPQSSGIHQCYDLKPKMEALQPSAKTQQCNTATAERTSGMTTSPKDSIANTSQTQRLQSPAQSFPKTQFQVQPQQQFQQQKPQGQQPSIKFPTQPQFVQASKVNMGLQTGQMPSKPVPKATGALQENIQQMVAGPKPIQKKSGETEVQQQVRQNIPASVNANAIVSASKKTIDSEGAKQPEKQPSHIAEELLDLPLATKKGRKAPVQTSPQQKFEPKKGQESTQKQKDQPEARKIEPVSEKAKAEALKAQEQVQKAQAHVQKAKTHVQIAKALSAKAQGPPAKPTVPQQRTQSPAPAQAPAQAPTRAPARAPAQAPAKAAAKAPTQAAAQKTNLETKTQAQKVPAQPQGQPKAESQKAESQSPEPKPPTHKKKIEAQMYKPPTAQQQQQINKKEKALAEAEKAAYAKAALEKAALEKSAEQCTGQSSEIRKLAAEKAQSMTPGLRRVASEKSKTSEPPTSKAQGNETPKTQAQNQTEAKTQTDSKDATKAEAKAEAKTEAKTEAKAEAERQAKIEGQKATAAITDVQDAQKAAAYRAGYLKAQKVEKDTTKLEEIEAQKTAAAIAEIQEKNSEEAQKGSQKKTEDLKTQAPKGASTVSETKTKTQTTDDKKPVQKIEAQAETQKKLKEHTKEKASAQVESKSVATEFPSQKQLGRIESEIDGKSSQLRESSADSETKKGDLKDMQPVAVTKEKHEGFEQSFEQADAPSASEIRNIEAEAQSASEQFKRESEFLKALDESKEESNQASVQTEQLGASAKEIPSLNKRKDDFKERARKFEQMKNVKIVESTEYTPSSTTKPYSSVPFPKSSAKESENKFTLPVKQKMDDIEVVPYEYEEKRGKRKINTVQPAQSSEPSPKTEGPTRAQTLQIPSREEKIAVIYAKESNLEAEVAALQSKAEAPAKQSKISNLKVQKVELEELETIISILKTYLAESTLKKKKEAEAKAVADHSQISSNYSTNLISRNQINLEGSKGVAHAILHEGDIHKVLDKLKDANRKLKTFVPQNEFVEKIDKQMENAIQESQVNPTIKKITIMCVPKRAVKNLDEGIIKDVLLSESLRSEAVTNAQQPSVQVPTQDRKEIVHTPDSVTEALIEKKIMAEKESLRIRLEDFAINLVKNILDAQIQILDEHSKNITGSSSSTSTRVDRTVDEFSWKNKHVTSKSPKPIEASKKTTQTVSNKPLDVSSCASKEKTKSSNESSDAVHQDDN